ncbi:hypothetical protein BH10PSE7_BH10PSE7_23090 [soil metagenome]
MDWSASHAGFVAAAYGLSAAILVALVAVTLLRDRRRRREAARLDGRNRLP